MTNNIQRPANGLPALRELGDDLTRISNFRRLVALAVPFFCCGAYFAFAAMNWWALAVVALVGLSFFSYGSTSHDLVHGSLALPSRGNNVLLCVIELLALRSGHAYRAAHLHHHARYPHSDDVESTAARKSWLGALAEGPTFQLRIWLWALRSARRDKAWIMAEGAVCVVLTGLAMVLTLLTPMFLVYAVMMIMGSWPIPLVTSFVPHDPHGDNELTQTRAFRGAVISALALEHLYHLEHHLYPSVPHQNWPKLARRLDPYLEKAGVKPFKLWF